MAERTLKHCPKCRRSFPRTALRCEADGELLSLPDPYRLLGRTLDEKYQIEALVGVGGMGAVYGARHLGIDRRVAVKILQPHLALDDGRSAQLFAREARLAGRLIHENIAAVMDAGRTDDGIAYLVLEWLEGRTLQQELSAGGPLGLERAAHIVAQVAAALDAAHAQDVIHRDLKPANIMLLAREGGGDQVKVLDFGLARLVGDSAAVSSPMGTPLYASPEQFQPGGRIDRRSDIYSLGIMLYQMVAGVPPFDAPAARELIRLHLTTAPPPLRRLRPETPLAVEQLIGRLLAKDPGQRPESAGEAARLFARAVAGADAEAADTLSLPAPPPTQLDAPRESEGAGGPSRVASRPAGHTRRRHALMACGLALLLALGWVAWRRGAVPTPAGPRFQSLVVWPFAGEGGDAEGESLAEGLTDGLASRLSRLPELRVFARTTTSRLRAQGLDPQAAARELKADGVLTGKVLRREGELVIQAELTRAADGAQIWGGQYRRRMSDAPAVQGQLAQEISRQLRLRLSGEQEQQISRSHTDNLEAYELYLQAVRHWKTRSQDGLKKSIDALRLALEKDPDYALAHAGLGASYSVMSMFGYWPPRDAMPQAEAAAHRALDLDETLAEAHIVLAQVRAQYDYDLAAAAGELRRAFALNPGSAEARHYYALCLAALGRFAESREELRQAELRDPYSPTLGAAGAWVAYLERRNDEAVARSQRALGLDANSYPARLQLAQAYERRGSYAQAIAEFKRARALSGDGAFAVARLGHAYAVAGKKGEARRLLAELKASANREYGVAWIYLGLGEKGPALEWLEQAYEGRAGELIYLKVDPLYDSLRSEARFNALLRRVGLAPQEAAAQ